MNASSPFIIEACVASVDDAVAACSGGADRLELNIGIELGGLTPTVALLEEVKRAVDLPVITMIRPRAAGFCYSRNERRVMLQDAELLLDAGADGIVSGALLDDGSLDFDFWRQLRRVSDGRDLVFHRASDIVSDQSTLLQSLIDTGTTRVLTSGGAKTAWIGRDQISRLILLAHERIEVLAGSGVTPNNVVKLVDETGCSQVHGTFRDSRYDDAGYVADGYYPATSESLVAATRTALVNRA